MRQLGNLAPAGARSVPQIVLGLHTHPEIRRGAQRLGQTQSHIGGNAGRAVQHARQRDTRYTQVFGRRRDRQLGQVFPENRAGVRRIVHTHGDHLMVVRPVDQWQQAQLLRRIVSVEFRPNLGGGLHQARQILLDNRQNPTRRQAVIPVNQNIPETDDLAMLR